MHVRNAICISIDGLRASALGAYGNTWHPTPGLDLLASQSHVFDWMLSDRPALEGFFVSAWGRSERSLVQRLSAAGAHTVLTTDDRATAERADTCGFGEIRRIEFTSEHAASTIDETQLAQLFGVAVDQIESWAAPVDPALEPASRLLWLHARGFRGAWDAPLELRESLLDDEDPPAPTFVTPPALTTVDDHDALLLHRAAYAAQTMVLDECVGALLAALSEYNLNENTLLILTAPRGYALGEHGAVGGDATALYSELLHVPCLVRTPDAAPPRSPQLVQPADLGTTLLEWFGAMDSESAPPATSLLSREMSPGRQYVVAANEEGGRAIRTPAWLLYQPPPADPQLVDPADASMVELYLKPDDRWEANEIADRCPDVAARLLAVLDRAASPDDSAAALRLEPLDDDLIAHPR